jgi:hypothetical protein
VLQVLTGARTAAEACRQYQLSAQRLNRWKAQFLEEAPEPQTGPLRVRLLAAGVAATDIMLREINVPGPGVPPLDTKWFLR